MRATVRMVRSRGQRVGKVLIQPASGMKTHQLHAEADPKDGKFRKTIHLLEQGQFELLSSAIDQAGLRMGFHPEGFHDGIIPPGEHEAVEAVQDRGDIVNASGEDHGRSA